MSTTVTMQQTVVRKVGRPRAFQDEDVYQAMSRVIGEVGYTGLTFSLIADQIGCTTSALIRRFGDKRALVQGFITWLERQQSERFAEGRSSFASPLEALKARWFIGEFNGLAAAEVNPTHPETYLAFFIEARCEPAYRPHLARLNEDFESGAATILGEAHRAREIVECDYARVARTLNCAMTGAISLWMDRPSRPLKSELNEVFDAVIAPYRVTPS
jgi:AcrR family transcriptional regulator